MLILILFIIIIIIYPKKYKFVTEEPFIIVSSYSAGPDDYRSMYDTNISISDNGKMVIYSTGSNQLSMKNSPELEVTLNEKEVNQVKKAIQQNKFLRLPKDVSSPSEDGGFDYATVKFADQTKKVGGLNSTNEKFNAVLDSVWQVVEDDDYKKWENEIEEHIWELNSLRKSDKSDYQEEKPFFELGIETQATEELPLIYEHYITINQKGNLILEAKVPEDKKNLKMNSNNPTLEIKLTENELINLKELIQENFWKLNESIYRPEGKKGTEYITVNLSKEDKTVKINDAVNPRFTAIRDYVVDLLDQKDYQIWREKIEDDLWEENILNSKSKTDYSLTKPFFIYTTNFDLEGNEYENYYHHISIDSDGTVLIYMNKSSFKGPIEHSPLLKQTLGYQDLKKIQSVIQKHFWEIEEYSYSYEGKKYMETMVLELTDDTLKVTGNNPDDEDFNIIRQNILNLFDDKVAYENWLKEINEFINS